MTELTDPGRAAIASAGRLEGPRRLDPDAVSVVIPVRDNQAGLDRLLASLRRVGPLEVIVVDDDSALPVQVAGRSPSSSVRVVRGSGLGPASARNAGARHARGEWLLFVDSDCTVSSDLLVQYERAMDGSLAYTGGVRSLASGCIGRFYDRHAVLAPAHDGRSAFYVVTANALVWRHAFEVVDGFDESFRLAAAEDVDLGIRMSALGRLGYVPEAYVDHDYGGVTAFARRFWRYGRGNVRLSRKHGGPSSRPPLVSPDRSTTGLALGSLRFVAFGLGLRFEKLIGSAPLRLRPRSSGGAARATGSSLERLGSDVTDP